MATAMVGAAFSVVGKALAPLTGELLKNWAASMKLGDNVQALERELLLVKALLEPTLNREIDNSALKELLVRLQELGYDAEDVLDEMDYFRIQDELDGTFDAANKHARGYTHNLALNLQHTAKALNCLHSSCFSTSSTTTAPPGSKSSRWAKLTSRSRCNSIQAVGKCFPCSSLPCVPDDNDKVGHGLNNNRSPQPRNLITNSEPPKLRFNRVDASKRMQDIVKKLQLLRQDVSSILATLGSNWSTVPNIAQSRPITTSESIEPKLYGRDLIMNSIIHDITKGKHSGDALTVIPIVGLGGIGKTTLAQHIYHSGEVQDQFDVRVWTCVSLNFEVNTLLTKIEKDIPKVDAERGTIGELIGQRLKNKRFLLVLDDIWDCTNEDQWKELLLPFRKSQAVGNVIMVTTRFPAQAQIMVTKIDHSIYLEGIDKTEFKELFLHIVFGDNLPPKHDTSILEIGNKIVNKLKCSPLAAKTVGRLLKTHVDLDHWTRVLESKEWEQSNDNNDIMPALKLSYDYLAPQLQRCFFYCALFPQDYKFKREELINFWIGLDVLHSSFGENKRLEDIGLSHLMKLVNHGFFEREGKEDGSASYTIHDLLHELAWKVSSQECLSIISSEVRSLQIPPSIRHLSISIDDTGVQDRLTLKNCVEDFRTLDKRLKVEKLRSLLLFGKHHYFLNTFGHLFRQAKALRVVLLTNADYDVEQLLHNFYNLLHLRYLRIQNFVLPRTRFSRFYHLMVLDAKHCYINGDLQRNMSSLVKLRCFLVRNDEIHARIVEVGKLKSLQELRQFAVKKDNQGFELSQIGKLVQLRGSLCIDNLENVQVKDEADEAKLLQKDHLHELILRWNLVQSTNDSTLEEHVLERLKPSSNLLRLSIVGHRGAACPSWLGKNLSVKRLESLCLDGVAWKTFPPIGELWLVNVPREDILVDIPDIKFGNLRKLKLVNLPTLKTWALHAPCQLFPFLEVLSIKGCSQLEDLSFSHSACCQQEKDGLVNFFPRLSKLKIQNCQQLLSFPPVPWTASCSTLIEGTGNIHTLACPRKYESEYIMEIKGKDTADSMFWNVLAFHNLIKLKEIEMEGCQPMPLHCLQMLSSLRILTLDCVDNEFPFVEGNNHAEYQFSVESMHIKGCSGSGKELTQLLTYFPKLLELQLLYCVKTTGLLLLPPQLQNLCMSNCPELSVHLNPLDNNKEEGLRYPSPLRWLEISNCPKLLASYSSPSFSSYFTFPSSLEYLRLQGKVGMEAPMHLSNLTSLTRLCLSSCGDLRGQGLLVTGTPNSFVSSEPSQVNEQGISCCSSKLQYLSIDDVAGFTAMPSLLFSSLAELTICEDIKVKHFTEEQETLLFVNSLEEITFMSCRRLRYLPAQLRALPNLKRLCIWQCVAIKMLPDLPSSLQELDIKDLGIRSLPEPDGLPSSLRKLSIICCPEIQSLPDSLPCSLQELVIERCEGIQSLPKDGLPNSLQTLHIYKCPAIRSLPKVDDLPSSLRKLTYERGREDLERQCLKLKRIIPKVKV